MAGPGREVPVSEPQASGPAPKASDPATEVTPDHRRRTTRQVRHTARATLHALAGDDLAMEDADLRCPQVPHDVGRKSSPKPRRGPKPGRRPGFKVWKTPFWKRRRALWAAQNAAARRLAKED
jgi:hypothetical protein